MDKKKQKDILKEGGVSSLKALIALIPYAGTAINEAIFETRGRIKQNRINRFVINFSEYIGEFNEDDVDIEQIKTEEFGDFFEELIIRVAKTRSETKLKALRNLLVNQLTKPKEIEIAELLLDIASGLQEKQLPILIGFNDNFGTSYVEESGFLIKEKEELKLNEKKLKSEYWKYDSVEDASFEPDVRDLERIIKDQKKSIQKNQEIVDELKKPFTPDYYDCEGYEYFYLVQDLVNKGLCIDMGVKYGAEPYELVEISQLGMDLIDYIKEEKPAPNSGE